MAKKEFPNKELPDSEGGIKAGPSGLSGKISGFSGKAFSIIKFILGICLLFFVYSFSAAFLKEFDHVASRLRNYFWSGAISLLIVYLFVWEPAYIYQKGHRLMEIIFNFFKPLVKVAPFLLPIYTIILFVLYGILSLMISDSWLIHYTMFLIGFSFVMHLIFSAKAIRTKKNDLLKANYIFGFSLIYIIDSGLLAFCFNLVFKEFSFVNFSNSAYQIASNIFYAVFKQLFLR